MSSVCRAAFVLLSTLTTVAAGQQRPQAIVGRVTTDSGVAIAGADVIVTIAPSAETVVGKSDASGEYRVDIANATGEYLLYIGALGRKPFRQRVTIAAGDSIATVNVKLAPAVVTVEGVKVAARRPRPPRSLGDNPPGMDGNSKVVDGVTNALPPELQGNLDAMASLVPGVGVTSAGVSAFGLGSDANMTTLNGMTFTGGAVPRDISTTTNVLLSPWDPTRGGFSGALTQATVAQGTNITQHRAHVSFDDPALQVGDPTASQYGQKFTDVQLSDTRSGAFSLDKYFYNYSIQVSRQMTPVASLLDLNADALAHAGVSSDSAFRLTQILGTGHVPLTLGGIPSQRTTTSALFLERFDRAVPNPAGNSAPAPIYSLIVGGNYLENRAGSLSPTVLPASTGKSTTGGAFVQALYSTYFGAFGDYTNATAANVSYRDNSGSPFLDLPSGNVLIASSLDGTTPTIGSLGFGGNSALARDNRVLSWEMNNQTDFLVRHSASLPAKLYFQARYEHFDQSVAANRLGAFNFASLGDLASNVPSSYSRTLVTPDRSGGEWTGATALGGSWSTKKLILAGGARVDANAFTGLPALNPALASTFGIRNDESPNSVALSPRLGFNWYPHAQSGTSVYGGNGSFTYRGGYQIRGGVGEFRNFLPSALLSDAIGSTGLPGSTERLSCVGPAAPAPNWAEYMTDPAAVPSSCLGGATAFADTAPNVTLIDRSYSPSRAWRATLGWTNTLFGNYVTVDGTYSWNLDQAGSVDLNFAGAPRFTLSSEGDRTVFVPASSIVAATGSSSPVDARKSSEFGSVSDRVSDLRGDTRQITVYTIPNIPFRFGIITLGYSYIDARSQARGFDQSTGTDPRLVEWAPSSFTPRHNFVLQAAKPLFSGNVALTLAGRVMSGLPYTPTVAGDGWLNDRAFIFDPAHADSAVARGLTNLLANGSGSARACLSRQRGLLAARKSCVGPWTSTMNASILVPNVPHTNRRVAASLNIANPLGGLDQLLHGSNALHGWGSAPLIDGTLYRIRGFNPASDGYTYEVNPRFGATDPSMTTLRAPFRLTLDIRVDYGHSAQEQALDLNLRIKPPLAGTRASVDTIRNRYERSSNGTGFSDIYRIMIHFADSLAISSAQMVRIIDEQKVLQAKADSIYGGLANYLVALPSNYDAKDAVKRATDASGAMWKVVHAEAPFLKGLLTPGQIRLLPGGLREMVTTPGYKGRFFYGF